MLIRLLSPFWLVAFSPFGQSVATKSMIDLCCRLSDCLMSSFRQVAGDRSTVTGITASFRRVARWFNQLTPVRDSDFALVFGCFLHLKNCHTELTRELVDSWEEWPSVDMISLRHLLRQSSKKLRRAVCELRPTNLRSSNYSTVELLVYDHPQNHIGVVV